MPPLGIWPPGASEDMLLEVMTLVNFFWQMGQEFWARAAGLALWPTVLPTQIASEQKALPHTLHLKGAHLHAAVMQAQCLRTAQHPETNDTLVGSR